MGSEKPLQQIGGVSLIERVAAAVTPCVDEMLVVTNRPELYAFLGLRMIPDTYEGRGPLGGIHAALTHIGSPSALIVATDYPFLRARVLEKILGEDPEGGVVVPRIQEHLHPLCGHYAAEAVHAVEEALRCGELKVLSLIGRLKTKVLNEDQLGGEEEARSFFNVNTPEDLRRAEVLRVEADSRE